MYDKRNRVAVDNPCPKLYMYPPQNLGKGQIENGKNLAALIHIDTEFMKDRNIIDYWLAAHPKKAEKLMKDSENSLKPQEVYKRQIERVPKQEIDAIKQNKKSWKSRRFIRVFKRQRLSAASRQINGPE